MTTIATDNPLLQFRIWCYDITWQYWYVWLVVAVIVVWLIIRHFAKQERKWDRDMEQQCPMPDDLRRKAFSDYAARADISRISEGHFECEFKDFRIVIDGGRLAYTDKKTGNTEIYNKEL